MRTAPLLFALAIMLSIAAAHVAHADYYIKLRIPSSYSEEDFSKLIEGVYDLPNTKDVITICERYYYGTYQIYVNERLVKIPACRGVAYIRIPKTAELKFRFPVWDQYDERHHVKIFVLGRARGGFCWSFSGGFGLNATSSKINTLTKCDSNVTAIVVPWTYIQLGYSTWLRTVRFPSLGLQFKGPSVVWGRSVSTWWKMFGVSRDDARAEVEILYSENGRDHYAAWVVTPSGVYKKTKVFTPDAPLPGRVSSSVLYAVAAGGAAALAVLVLGAPRRRR